MDQLQFILKDRNGTTYNLGMDSVDLAPQPDGIESSNVVWEMSKKYWGRFPSFTMSLQFTKKAATLLRQEFYTNRLNSYMELTINKLNNHNDLSYFNVFVANTVVTIFDWSTFSDNDFFVAINVKRAGFNAALTQNDGTAYTLAQLPFDTAYMVEDLDNPIYGAKPIEVFKCLADFICGGNGQYKLDNYKVKSDYLESLNQMIFNGKSFTWRDVSGAIFNTINSGSTFSISLAGLYTNLYAVHFPSEMIGYVVGDNGIILVTKDGGITWNTQLCTVTYPLYSVFFTTDLIGIAVGSNGTVIRTTDGGDNWTEITSGTSHILRSVHFPTKSVGYISGMLGAILKTTDGGLTWELQTSETSHDLYGICFTDTLIGVAVGGTATSHGTVLRTVNGGTTWTVIDDTLNACFYSAYFSTSQVVYICGDDRSVRKSIDGGVTWVQKFSGVGSGGLFSIQCTDANTVYSVGHNGMAVKSLDGGDNWFYLTGLTSLTNQNLFGICLTSSSAAWVVGLLGSETTHHPIGLITTSLSDFFDSINAHTAIGMGVELDEVGDEVLRLEKREYFFNENVVAVLTDASNIKIEQENDLIYNSIKVGFGDQNYKDETTSDKEVCQWSVFGFKFTNYLPKNQLSMISKYRADGQGIIELLATDDASKSFSDMSSGDIFLCQLWSDEENYPGKKFLLKGFVNDCETGIAAVSYGVEFSPRRTLANNVTWISDLFPGFSNKTLSFLSGFKSMYKLESKTLAETNYLRENKSINLVDPSHILPISLTADVPYDVDLIETINAYPCTLIGIEYKGVTIYGYISKLDLSLAFKGSNGIKLLLSANNDLTTLIR